jgi:hypothetical protein
MNETTLALSQLMGPVLLLLGISFHLKRKDYFEMFKQLEQKASILFLAGIVEFTAGLSIVLHHNLWNSPAEIVITILGWGMIAEGSMALLNDKISIKKMMRSMIPSLMSVSSILLLLLGGYLCYVGYFV